MVRSNETFRTNTARESETPTNKGERLTSQKIALRRRRVLWDI